MSEQAPQIPPHQQRVLAEYEQIATWHVKLDAFILGEMFRTLDKYEQDRLYVQNSIQHSYMTVLISRLENMGLSKELAEIDKRVRAL